MDCQREVRDTQETMALAKLPETSRIRLEYVDGIRALAALIVYLNHAYAQVSTGGHVDLRSPWSWARCSMVIGHLSVTIFIVISGFCLTLPVVAQGGQLRGGVKGFLRRRARRILPPYYAAVCLCLVLIWTVIGKPTGSLWDYPQRVDALAIISHLLLLQDLFATSRINYVFWSIAVEWHIYFIVPLLVLAWRRFGSTTVVIGCLALGYAVRLGLGDTRVARMHPQFLGMFALGMLAAYIVRSPDARFVRLKQNVPWTAVTSLLLLANVGLISWWGIELAETRFHWLDLPIGIMAAATLSAGASKPSGLIHRVFSWTPLVAVGTFSYSLYLIHAPLLQIMWQYALVPLGLSREASLSILLTIGFGLVVVLSYVFFRLFEAPFMGSAQASTIDKPQAEPAA